MKKETFRGHGIEAMFINVTLALSAAVLPLFCLFRPAEEILYFRWLLVFGVIYGLPFPTYLFFEIKHLILNDGIADDRSTSSILVFGGQSLLGLTLQILILVASIKLEIFGQQSPSLIVGLSLFASFGACLGLTDLHLLRVIFPKKVFQHCLLVLKSWRLMFVCLSTTLLLSVLTTFFL